MKALAALRSYPGPVAVFPIGISGSGKSFLFNKKNFRGWTIVNSDELRKSRLKDLRRRKARLVVAGVKQLADPENAAHIFHPDLRDWVFTETQRQVRTLAGQKKNLVLDLTNIHLQRVYVFNLLRRYRYTLVAVMFRSRSLQFHLRNVKRRSRSGGIDLSPKNSQSADATRIRIILEQKNCMRSFAKNLKKDVCGYEKLPKIPQNYLKTSAPSFEAYLKTVPARYLKSVKKLARLDRVDEIIAI